MRSLTYLTERKKNIVTYSKYVGGIEFQRPAGDRNILISLQAANV